MSALATLIKYVRASADGVTSIATVADNEAISLIADSAGRLWSRIFVNGAAVSNANPFPVAIAVSATPLTWVNAVALANSGVVKAAAGELFTFYGFCTAGTKNYFQVYNTAAVPADGAVPIESIPVSAATASSDASFALGILPAKDYTVGMSWALSSTPATKTLVAGASTWVDFGIL